MNNKRLLIICNGPSVSELVEVGFDHLPEDLDTVGCSLAYRFFKEIDWWPTYYCLTDPKVVSHHQDAFQELILNLDNGIKQFFLCTKLEKLGIDISFDDPYNRVIEVDWQVTGQAAFKITFEYDYESLYIIGCDNKYFWDHSLVKPMPNQSFEDNRAMVLADVPVNPNYGIPNYLREGDITSWLFNHPDKSYSTSSNNKVWQDLIDKTVSKNIEVIDFSEGNLPVEKKHKSIVGYLNL